MAEHIPDRFAGKTSNGIPPGNKYLRDLIRAHTDDQAPLAYGPLPEQEEPIQPGQRSQERREKRGHKPIDPHLQETYPGSGVWRLVK